MHAYKVYIQSLQMIQGGGHNPSAHVKKCHAPKFDCAAVACKLVGPEEREGWRLQNWCSRQ